jgi:hypothetical protein
MTDPTALQAHQRAAKPARAQPSQALAADSTPVSALSGPYPRRVRLRVEPTAQELVHAEHPPPIIYNSWCTCSFASDPKCSLTAYPASLPDPTIAILCINRVTRIRAVGGADMSRWWHITEPLAAKSENPSSATGPSPCQTSLANRRWGGSRAAPWCDPRAQPSATRIPQAHGVPAPL